MGCGRRNECQRIFRRAGLAILEVTNRKQVPREAGGSVYHVPWNSSFVPLSMSGVLSKHGCSGLLKEC